MQAKAVVTYPREPAVFLSQAPGYSRGETPVVCAQEDVVVRHQRGAANGHDTPRGIHLYQSQRSNERARSNESAERHEQQENESTTRCSRLCSPRDGTQTADDPLYVRRSRKLPSHEPTFPISSHMTASVTAYACLSFATCIPSTCCVQNWIGLLEYV